MRSINITFTASVIKIQSLAVKYYVLEPHLSQLMEDLEAISKEKEALNAENENAEKKFALATSVAEKQKVAKGLYNCEKRIAQIVV